MDISASLMKNYSQSITPDIPTNTEKILYGTAVVEDDAIYVQYDGSSVNTPVATTVDVKNGDRVMVLLKDHASTIMGNITSPTDQTAQAYRELNTYFQLTTELDCDVSSIGYIILDRSDNLVTLYFKYRFTDYTAIDTPLIYILDKYAPKTDQICPIIVDMGNDSYVSGYTIIGNDGIISQSISNKCIGITGSIKYVI